MSKELTTEIIEKIVRTAVEAAVDEVGMQGIYDFFEKWVPPQEVVKKWEPEGGYWWATSGDAAECCTTKPTREFGIERKTKEAAEKAAKQMRSHNRLLAWVAEHDSDWEADWDDSTKGKYYIYKEYGCMFAVDYVHSAKILGVVYMSEKAAYTLCAGLNNGSIVL